MAEAVLLLTGITFVAGIVTGALGYGFSSITVPLALLYLTNRILNPAIVLIEIALNGYVVWVNRAALPAVWSRVWALAAGVTPGVALGTLVIARVNDTVLKLITYAALLPAVLLQAAGFRRPIATGRAAEAAIGAGVGTLYAVTTISGPPLAALLNNQGVIGAEFRAGLGLIRLVESVLTGAAYAVAGLFVSSSLVLLAPLSIGAGLGVPIGVRMMRRVSPETFRRISMSFDAWIVGFGLSRVILQLQPSAHALAYGILTAVVAADTILLVRYFRATAWLGGGVR